MGFTGRRLPRGDGEMGQGWSDTALCFRFVLRLPDQSPRMEKERSTVSNRIAGVRGNGIKT